MLSGRTTTTVQAPAAAPIDLNSAGKPDWRELAPLFGLIMLSLLPAGAGGAMVVANWPREGMSGWQTLWLGMGGAFMFGGGSFFWTLRASVLSGVKGYYARVNDWHNAVLDKYIEGDGMVTAQQISEWVYTENDMRHVALAVLWLILHQPKSLSIERLTKGPMLLSVGHRAFKMMDMSQDGAANFLNLLARAGVINGRGPRTAGTIAIMDPRTAALKVLAEASRNPAMIGAEEA
jgi:hypothetical protein